MTLTVFLQITEILSESSLIIALYTSRMKSGRFGAAETETLAVNVPKFSRHSPQHHFRHIYIFMTNLNKVRLKSWDGKNMKNIAGIKDHWKSWGKYMARKKNPGTKICVGHFNTNKISFWWYRNVVLDHTYFLSVCLVAADCVYKLVWYLLVTGIWSFAYLLSLSVCMIPKPQQGILQGAIIYMQYVWIFSDPCEPYAAKVILFVNYFTCCSLEGSYMIVCVCSFFAID